VIPNQNSYEKLYFLQGGGEMGEITRAFDWSNTTIGTPDQWPANLRMVLSIVLHSAFPMFIFWGKEMLCFYNDAYRPSLGADGRHPAVGKPGKEVWPDVWDFIAPLLQQVRETGAAAWFEDQLLPIYRNGRMEDVYWTFSYSAIYSDKGTVDGVLVTCTETTAKIKAAAKLFESEKRFQNLVQDASIGIVVLTGDEMRVAIINQAYVRLTDRTYDDLIGKPFFEVVPEFEVHFRPTIDQVLRTNESLNLFDYAFVTEFSKREKKESFLNIVCQPYTDDGTMAGVMVLCQDVTEQVTARQKAESSEFLLRSLMESAPFPISVMVAEDMRVSFANDAILEVWGKGPEVIGKPIGEVLTELNNRELFNKLQEVYTSGKPYHAVNQRFDVQIDDVTKTYYFNYSLIPLPDKNGDIYAVMNISADVTDLNRAKERVEESRRNIRNVINKAPVAMCILKTDRFVVEIANERMFQLWGKTAEEVMHKPIFDGLPEARDQGFEEILTRVFVTEESHTAHGAPVNLPRNGKTEMVYVNYVFEAYRESNNVISGVIAVALDVTSQALARQKIEEVVAERTQELAESNSHLQRLNGELAQFAYIASHDLQEPARKVSTFVQMLEAGLTGVDDRSRHYLERIKSATSRMIVLVRDVLAYSQLAKEKQVSESIQLNQIIEEIKNDLELVIEEKGAEILYDNLPAITGFRIQITQLFGNLISNALKFSRSDVKPVVKVTCAKLPDDQKPQMLDRDLSYFHFEVSDNGIGFNLEYSEQIFNIFQRLHGNKEYEGTGIGLAMCKKIVQNHKGHIFASSQPQNGSIFHVILPENII
jgi:PAS domain S-box-containing protein